MTTPGIVSLAQGTPGTPANPASGFSLLEFDANNHPFLQNPSGVLWTPVLNGSIIADVSIANADTIVEALTTLPAGLLAVAGTTINIQGSGSFVAGAAAASVFTVRAGTAGTTGDAAICTFTLANSGTTGTTAFFFEILVTCRAVGAGAGTTTGTLCLTNFSATTGIYTSTAEVVTATGSSLTLTTPTAVDLSYTSGSGSNTCTFKTCNISILCP